MKINSANLDETLTILLIYLYFESFEKAYVNRNASPYASLPSVFCLSRNLIKWKHSVIYDFKNGALLSLFSLHAVLVYILKNRPNKGILLNQLRKMAFSFKATQQNIPIPIAFFRFRHFAGVQSLNNSSSRTIDSLEFYYPVNEPKTN